MSTLVTDSLGGEIDRKPRRGMVWIAAIVVLFLIGGIVFLALPNIMSVGMPVENLSITRAEALNMATAAFIHSKGRESANAQWGATTKSQERYDLLRPFLAFAPEEFGNYMPEGYVVILPNSLLVLSKLPLVHGGEIGY